MKTEKSTNTPKTEIERKHSIKNLRIEKETADGGKFKLQVTELHIEWSTEEGRDAAMNALGEMVGQIVRGGE